MLLYHHTQISRMIIVILCIVFGLLVPIFVLGGQEESIVLVLGIFVLIIILFGSLTIEVTTTTLQFHLGLG